MLANLFIWTIRGYQRLISRNTPATCRFHPTCSQYVGRSIADMGLVRGLLIGSARVLRCHPFHPGGFDPVPEPGTPLLKALRARSEEL